MRRLLLLAWLGTGCGTDAPTPVVSDRGFTIESPPITIMPREEVTYCWYFSTPNTEDIVVRKWSSVMTPGSHHMIMYTTPTATQPPGTITNGGCGGLVGGSLPSWTYAAQTPEALTELPLDDGSGVPLGQQILAGTSGYFQMHYLNQGDEPLAAHVTLTAEGFAPDVTHTPTAAFVTFNNQISVPPNAVNHVESQTCNVPDGLKFWQLSTHAHKQAINTRIKDGEVESTSVAFTSDDWEHPGAQRWLDAPYYAFASKRLTYECTYNNIGDNALRTVESGASAETDEMCMATGYYFPADKPLFCLNSLGPF